MTRLNDTSSGADFGSPPSVEHLNHVQLKRLTDAFQLWYATAPSLYLRRVRGRYWLAFLLLRFTGARIGEALSVDDAQDIDFVTNEVRIISRASSPDRIVFRRIPVPQEVMGHLITYLSHFPMMQGKVFGLDQGNFRREFYRRAEEAGIPKELSHPHILRHTRAIELLKAGVPLTMVRDLLGHTLTSTTAIYVEHTEVTATIIMRDKGLL